MMDDFEESRANIIHSMDSYIERIQSLRGIMLGVSISGVFLAPFAIAISTYLVTHPKFFGIVERQDEFGFMLMTLLVGIIFVSGIWMVTGIRQYRSLSSWKKRYDEYLKKRESLDNTISNKFHLDQE